MRQKKGSYSVREAETGAIEKPRKSDVKYVIRHLDGSERCLSLSKKATGRDLLAAFFSR